MALSIEQALKLIAKVQAGDTRAAATVLRELLSEESGTTLLEAILAALGYVPITMPGSGEVLFDDGGVVGGESDFLYDKATNKLRLVNGRLEISQNSELTPASNSIIHFAKLLSRVWPAMSTPDGFNPLIQPLIGSSWRKWLVQPTSNTSGASAGVSTIGGAFTAVDNFVYRAPAATNWATRNDRVGFQALAAAGSSTRLGCSLATVRRSATAGVGGFRVEIIFKLATNLAGFQFFAGVVPAAALTPAGDPSAQIDCFGIGFDAADAVGSNFFVMHNDAAGTCTRVATGNARDTTSAWRLIIDCPTGNASTLYWHLTNMNDGTSVSGSITTNLPTADAVLSTLITYGNGAIASRPEFDIYSALQEWPLN